jgi:hypothetical protein
MSLLLPIDRVVTLSIQPVDAAGNPAPVDGVPRWASTGPDKLTLTPSDDGLSAVLTPVGPLGQVQVSVTADGLLGPALHVLTGILDVQIVGGEAVSLGIVASELRNKS